jgi:hypothetical protein
MWDVISSGLKQHLPKCGPHRVHKTWQGDPQGCFCFSVGMGTKEELSSTGHIWAVEFHHVNDRSRFAWVLKLMTNLFLYISNFFSCLAKPRLTETADTEPLNMEARLYRKVNSSLRAGPTATYRHVCSKHNHWEANMALKRNNCAAWRVTGL